MAPRAPEESFVRHLSPAPLPRVVRVVVVVERSEIGGCLESFASATNALRVLQAHSDIRLVNEMPASGPVPVVVALDRVDVGVDAGGREEIELDASCLEDRHAAFPSLKVGRSAQLDLLKETVSHDLEPSEFDLAQETVLVGTPDS